MSSESLFAIGVFCVQWLQSFTLMMESIPSQLRRWLEFLATCLNQFSQKKGDGPLPEFRERVSEEESLKDIEITRESIYKKLMKLKVDEACGPDELHTKLLKQCAVQIRRHY